MVKSVGKKKSVVVIVLLLEKQARATKEVCTIGTVLPAGIPWYNLHMF